MNENVLKLKAIEWEEYRKEDGSLDVLKAYVETFVIPKPLATWHGNFATSYLYKLEMLQPIKSRQAATVAVVGALTFEFQESQNAETLGRLETAVTLLLIMHNMNVDGLGSNQPGTDMH